MHTNTESLYMYKSDMAVQNCIGDAFRGATWVALHNGGGCGWYAITKVILIQNKLGTIFLSFEFSLNGKTHIQTISGER